MPERDEQRMILEMIANGRISAAEGLELLQALGETGEFDEAEEEALDGARPEAAESQKIRRRLPRSRNGCPAGS